MNKIFQFLLVLSVGFLLTACGSKGEKEKTASIEIKTSEVYGDNAELISVVPGTYTLKQGDRVTLKIRLRLEQTASGKVDFVNGPVLRLKDADGIDAVDSSNQMELADGERQKMQTFLQQKPGTEQDFLFENKFDYDKYAQAAMEKTTSFTLEGLDIVYETLPDTASSDMEATTPVDDSAAASGNPEVDQWLDEFSDLVDNYADLVYSSDGNMSAGDLVKLAQLSTQASELVAKMDKMSNSLTPAQASRLAELEARLTSLSSEMVF